MPTDNNQQTPPKTITPPDTKGQRENSSPSHINEAVIRPVPTSPRPEPPKR